MPIFTISKASPEFGWLNAWIDFGSDGDWGDLEDHIFSAEWLDANTVHMLTFAVPPGAVEGPTFGRFRFCSQMRGLSFVGVAPDGEVEDYMVTIVPEPAALSLLALGGLALLRRKRGGRA